MHRGVVAVMLWCLAARSARADDGYLTRLAGTVRARLGDAAAAHVTRLVLPVPVKVVWSPQRLGSIDVGAPVAAVAAADLDGDGKAELYLVTSREVIAVAIAGQVRALDRVAFGGEPAVPASRDAVGTATVDGNAVIASVSAWAGELRVEWRQGKLTGRHGADRFLVCGERWQLAPGRNYFRRARATLFGGRCRGDLIDATGAPLHIRSELSTAGVLEVAVERCPAGAAGCQPWATYQIKDVGAAFEIADIDRDGTPEVIASHAVEPGDADAIRVIPLGSPGGKAAHKKSFNGGVAGIAVADIDGNGVPHVIALVRLAGATRVDVWRLN